MDLRHSQMWSLDTVNEDTTIDTEADRFHETDTMEHTDIYAYMGWTKPS